jgi:methionyl-tRNA formyltransferase
MRIVLITQDDPFYLPGNLDYLLKHLPDRTEVVGCVVSKVSPFGKKESFLAKARRTFDVFGAGFFLHYSFQYLASKLPGRASVRDVLKRHDVPELAITGSLNSEESLNTLRNLAPDLLISIAGNEIFRKPLIDLAPRGCLNLHTALLPKYRGLMPSFWVLKNGEKETGVSVFYVDEGIDSGPILVQERIDIGSMSQRELIKESKAVGMRAIIKAVEKIRDGDTATIPNDAADSTYFSFPTREDVREFKRSGARFY